MAEAIELALQKQRITTEPEVKCVGERLAKAEADPEKAHQKASAAGGKRGQPARPD